jgi:hypothetical protein
MNFVLATADAANDAVRGAGYLNHSLYDRLHPWDPSTHLASLHTADRGIKGRGFQLPTFRMAASFFAYFSPRRFSFRSHRSEALQRG